MQSKESAALRELIVFFLWIGKWSSLCPTPLVGTSVSKPQPGHINYQFSHNLAFIRRANSNLRIR